jgi:hypothetical protein
MAETRQRLQIGARITAATKERLDAACAAQGRSMSDLVDDALVAYLTAAGADRGGERGATPQLIAALQALVAELRTTMQTLTMALTPPPRPPSQPEAKRATYEEMYGTLVPDTAPPPAPLRPAPSRRGFLRKVFTHASS